MRAGIDTGGYQGLPQTGMTPLVHDETAVAWHTTWVLVLLVMNRHGSKIQVVMTLHKPHPETDSFALSLTISQEWVKPMSNQLLYMYNGSLLAQASGLGPW